MTRSSAVTAVAGLFLAGALGSPVLGIVEAIGNITTQASSYWYANMDHTGQYRGYAPGLDNSDSYSVFVAVSPEDGGAGIQKAINDASNGATRHGQWLASEPRVLITSFTKCLFCSRLTHVLPRSSTYLLEPMKLAKRSA